MRKALEAELVARHPTLYADVGASPRASAMAWGIAVGDGWFPIVETLSALVAERYPEARALQVKEKFGTLRFYVSGSDAWCEGVVTMAEAASGRICELTGRPGRVVNLGGLLACVAPDATDGEVGPDIAPRLARWRETQREAELQGGSPWRRDGGPDPEGDDAERRVARVRSEVPPGWAALADGMLGLLCRRDVRRAGAAPEVRRVFRAPDGTLAVEADGLDEEDRGVVACAAALAARTDPETGAMPLPGDCRPRAEGP